MMWSDGYTPTTSSLLLGISVPPYAIEIWQPTGLKTCRCIDDWCVWCQRRRRRACHRPRESKGR